MQITVKRDVLLETLGKVKSAVLKSSIQAFANVLLSGAKGVLTITANNGQVALVGTCKAKVIKDGSIGVSPSLLENFLRQVDSPLVSLAVRIKVKRWEEPVYKYDPETHQNIETGKEKKSSKTYILTVKAGPTTFTPDCIKPDEFPKLPKIQGKPVTLSKLDEALGTILYATAKEESRPVLNGVCITPKRGSIELAAADGFRLAITSTESKGKLQERLILPAAAAHLVKRFLTGNVVVQTWGKDETDRGVAFHQKNGLIIVAKPIEGTYPDYSQIIPKKGSLLRVKSEELRKAVNLAMSIKPGNGYVRLQTRGKNLIIKSHEGDNEVETSIPASGRINSAFDGRYLKDLLDKTGEYIELRMDAKAQFSPGVVRNNGATHVIMPMNIPKN